jgi:quercetin dioxygenase-like cupin family protein
MKKLRFLAPMLLVASLLLVACGDDDEPTPSVAEGVTEAERQLLAEASPETAPGQTLELTRVVVPADQGLAPHTHPGPQLAIIASGTLTYTVIDGEATVTRAAGTDASEVVTYSSGDRFELREGDSIIEAPLMVHEASNDTDELVIIYLSSLFPAGAPPATTVE